MFRSDRIERAIIDSGALETGEFMAHNGEYGNLKVNLEPILSEDGEHHVLAHDIADDLAGKLESYKPELIIPIPEGANYLGTLIGRRLGARVIYLAWQNKEERKLEYSRPQERIVVARSSQVVLVDDVFRTGSSFKEVIQFAGLSNKDVVGGVVWDRSDPKTRKKLGLPLESVVERYVPLRDDQ